LATNKEDGLRNHVLEFRFPPTRYLPTTLRNARVGALVTTKFLSRMNRRTKRREIRKILFDIWYNTAHYKWGDANEMVVPFDLSVTIGDLEEVTLHELGHVLGLPHNQDNYSMMNNTKSYTLKQLRGGGMMVANPLSRFLSRKDIQRIHELCGCVGEACDVEKSYQKIRALKE